MSAWGKSRARGRGAAASAAALALTLAACGGTQVSTDRFERTTAVEGRANTVNPLVGNKVVWWIESLVGKAPPHVVFHHLVVQVYPRGFSPSAPVKEDHYDRASDEEAAPLKVSAIASERCPFGNPQCFRKITVGITVGDAVLRQHVLTGYSIKLSDHTGDSDILTLPPAEIAQQLAAVDRLVAGPPPDPAPGAPRLGVSAIAASAAPYDGSARGLIVLVTAPQSPAALAGVMPGDRLLALDGEPLRVTGDLVRILGRTAPGATVGLEWQRGDRSYSAKAKF